MDSLVFFVWQIHKEYVEMQFPLEMQTQGQMWSYCATEGFVQSLLSCSSCTGCSATVHAGALSKIRKQQSRGLIQQYPNLLGHARPLLKQEL